MLGLRVGARLEIARRDGQRLGLTVAGLFQPSDPAAPAWDGLTTVLRTQYPLPEEPFSAGALTDPAGIAAVGGFTARLGYTWRYRIDERRIDTGTADRVLAAVLEVRRTDFGPGIGVATDFDGILHRFAEQMRAVRALLAVVLAGLLATLLGLLLLAAQLAVERRREEFALLRARGASVARLAGRTAAEGLLVLPLAVLAGWALGARLPGRPGGAQWLVLVVGLVALAATPALAIAGHRRVSFTGRRRDLVRHRSSVRRRTAELSLVAVAALGLYLLRSRGLGAADGVDPYLAAVPVLLAVTVAGVALRLFPWPVRQVGRLAARGRGAVGFLGLARAGRGAPVSAAPLAVLVLAISVGVFSGAVATIVSDARDRVADREIGADAALRGEGFGPGTAERVAAVPGVRSVALMAAEPGEVTGAQGGPGNVFVVFADAPALARVLADTGAGPVVSLPPALTAATPGAGPLPALVSTEVMRTNGDLATVTASNLTLDVSTTAVVDAFPGLAVSTDRFVVVPWQALPDRTDVDPNRVLVAGAGVDLDALRRAGDESQREYRRDVLGRSGDQPAQPTQVSTWAQHRRDLDRTGANDLLSFAFLTGAAGGTALALLAVGFAVLAGARARGQVLSRLRTMGLSARQGRRLLVVELVPAVGVAVLAGGLVGVLLPAALRPALGLDAFTGGVATRTLVDPALVGGALALVALALAVAVLAENVINRRLRLGTALRLGEETT